MDPKLLTDFTADTIAIQLATRTENLMPRTTRGFGVRFEEETGQLAVAVAQAQAEELIATLRKAMVVAVNLAHPISLRGIQVKGPVLAIEEVTAEATQAAAKYFEQFQRVIATIGITPEESRGMFHSGGARWVKMRPLEMFNQTPGRDAGSRL